MVKLQKQQAAAAKTQMRRQNCQQGGGDNEQMQAVGSSEVSYWLLISRVNLPYVGGGLLCQRSTS